MDSTKKASSAVSRDVIAPVSFRRGDVKWTARSSQVMTALAPLLPAPDAFLTEKESLLRDTVLVTLARLPASLSGEGRWLLRRTNYGKPEARVRDLFRRSGPMRAFQRGLDFERADVPTPRVLAAGIVRQWHQPLKGYLIVEEIHPAETLLEHLRRRGNLAGAETERIARVIARMHECGITHGDLTINNVLLDAQRRPWFIDLERARVRAWPVGRGGAVGDFFRMARHVEELGPAARQAGLRLLRHYCIVRGWTGQARSLATAILERLERKVGRRGRTG